MPLDALTFPSDDPVLTLLRVGRRRLVENGWCQHWPTDGDACCAGQAINYFTNMPERNVTKSFEYLTKSLPFFERPKNKPPTVPAYNDLPTTTLDDVLALYDRAIAARVEDLCAAEIVA